VRKAISTNEIQCIALEAGGRKVLFMTQTQHRSAKILWLAEFAGGLVALLVCCGRSRRQVPAEPAPAAIAALSNSYIGASGARQWCSIESAIGCPLKA